MRNKILISTILAFTLTFCSDNPTQNNEIPIALQDNKSSYKSSSKRGTYDLVESLYNEVLNKNIELKKLDEKINELHISKSDSTSLFNKFNEKNQSYYSSANRHLDYIKDSLLRDRMKILIKNNVTKYNLSTARHNDLIKIIETNGLTLYDLHQVLKITSTLPLIEKYQQDNLPGTQSLEGYIKQQDETIRQADTVTKL